MKRNINNSIEITLLEKRLISEEYAKANYKKQLTLANMRNCNSLGINVDKNGGIK